MLTCIRMQNYIKIYHAAQEESLSFSLNCKRTDRQTDRQTDTHADYSAHLRVVLLIALRKSFYSHSTVKLLLSSKADPEGGQGVRTPPPPEK